MIERYSRPRMKRVWSDENKFDKWLEVEIAVCRAWAELGVIPKEALGRIEQARYSLEGIQRHFQETRHDMTAFLRSLAENLGEEARFVHFGLTSSDVMDTALSLQLKEAGEILEEDLDEALEAVAEKAREHKYTVMIGRTHGVHAEPITFGLKLALWAEELKRHRERLRQAREMVLVGKISGAVGTYATVPPEVERLACSYLGLKPAPVSSQIIQRDRHAQFVLTLALLGASLEKFAVEIRGLQRTEVGEVAEPFAPGQTGSSAMPHKRNPELCERICGLSRILRGHAITALENIALWHERDISHSSAERIILPDSCLALDYMLGLFVYIMRNLEVYPERMQRNLNLTRGLIFSQRVLLALIEKGMGRQEAYGLVQEKALRAWEEERGFFELLKEDPRITAALPPEELEKLFDYSFFLRYVDTIFQRLGLEAAPALGRGDGD